MEYIPAKHLLHRSRSSEWFGTDHTMNIYRGCCHGCLYCDSRSDCYRIEEFGRVRAKADALRILRDDLARKVRPALISMGAMSDPYNPFEAELQLTRHALELIDAYDCGVTIATKSDLIVRDIDLLTAIQRHSPVICKLTVTTADDALAAKLEPNAPPPSRRLGALKELSGAGLFAGVLLMPVLPFLEDSDESVLAVVEGAAQAGARFIYSAFGVTMRQGQREYFLDGLERAFPRWGLKERYLGQYGDRYQCASPRARALWKVFTAACRERGILYDMKSIIRAASLSYGDRQLTFSIDRGRDMEIRGRFAPTPSGRMHLGNLLAALLAWLDVRSAGGELMLRIEDLDTQRTSAEFAAQLMDDLRWLGLDWDEGGLEPAYMQSCRTAYYEEAFRVLEEKGLIYPCYCTRSERMVASAPHRDDGAVVYSGKCFHLTAAEREALERQGRRPAWRVRCPELDVTLEDGNCGIYTENLARDCGDFIVRRSDGVFAYQLAVVVDDALMGVNHVVRGRDLLCSAPRQAWLHQVLGYEPPQFFHTPLLLAADGRRLAKRDHDLDMGALRNQYTPEALTGLLAFYAGLLDKPQNARAEELIPLFSWVKVPKNDVVVGSS